MEELKKKNIPWEQFIVSSHMKLEIASIHQLEMKIPFPPTSDAPTETSKKRKSKSITQDKVVVKELEEEDKEAYHSPWRDSSPPPAP